MKLNELKAEKARLEKEIKKEELRLLEDKKRDSLAKYYVRIVCLTCEGLGEVSRGGADIESDPPYEDLCEDCNGKGFLFARNFEDNKKHDTEFDERTEY
jgi:DnaJ-class molecular chaperone